MKVTRVCEHEDGSNAEMPLKEDVDGAKKNVCGRLVRD